MRAVTIWVAQRLGFMYCPVMASRAGLVVLGFQMIVACGESSDGQSAGSSGQGASGGTPGQIGGSAPGGAPAAGAGIAGSSGIAGSTVPAAGGEGGADQAPGAGGADAAGAGGAGGDSDGASPYRPMPNPLASGLPHPAAYDTSKPGIVIDRVTKLMWQRELSAATYNIDNADSACPGVRIGGYDDWRLPSRLELVTLVDFTRTKPAIAADIFPTPLGTFLWSSTPFFMPFSGEEKWMYGFDAGSPVRGWSQTNAPVRCVRGAPFAPDYEIGTGAMAGITLDRTTGLMWEQTVHGDKLWSEATDYCESLTLGDLDGWRVPSMKELQLVIDDSKYDLAIDINVFIRGAVADYYLWSSSENLALEGKPSPWIIRLKDGLFYDYGYGSGFSQVLCVR